MPWGLLIMRGLTIGPKPFYIGIVLQWYIVSVWRYKATAFSALFSHHLDSIQLYYLDIVVEIFGHYIRVLFGDCLVLVFVHVIKYLYCCDCATVHSIFFPLVFHLSLTNYKRASNDLLLSMHTLLVQSIHFLHCILWQWVIKGDPKHGFS